eukprot:scaffold69499_cov55-Phaeocystis_antarctica.AAC.1
MASEAAAARGRTPRLGLGQGLGQGLGLGSCMRTGARNCLLGTRRRSRLGISWPFTRRRGAGVMQRRKWPDGGCSQRGGRRRGYATACRAGSNRHFLLGH